MGLFAVGATIYTTTQLRHRLIEHRRAEDAAVELAKHDALTGLPNRRKLDETFDPLMDSVAPEECRAILMLDVDGFKPVNDVYGHAVGDILLQQFAERLLTVTGKNSLVARLGGDEFAIISPPLDTPEKAGHLAQALLASIREPYDIEGREIRVGSGIGIALYPQDGYSSSELLRRADIALYRAKTSGTSLFRFFELEMDASLLHRALLEQRMRRAMANQELVPEFLPIVRFSDNRIIGFEALARWNDEEFGMVPPSQFIPIAEDVGLISELTEQILIKASRAAADWPDDIGLSLNISSLKLQEQSFPLRLTSILAESRLTPRRLTLDITEPALLRNTKLAQPILHQLSDSGIHLALDDYGVGSSSLNFLRNFPFDTVKIHDDFTASMIEDDECAALVEAILILAKGLKLSVIAEGIEDRSVVDRLQALGCDAGQGRVYGPTVTPEGALDLIRAQKTLPPRAPELADMDRAG